MLEAGHGSRSDTDVGLIGLNQVLNAEAEPNQPNTPAQAEDSHSPFTRTPAVTAAQDGQPQTWLAAAENIISAFSEHTECSESAVGKQLDQPGHGHQHSHKQHKSKHRTKHSSQFEAGNDSSVESVTGRSLSYSSGFDSSSVSSSNGLSLSYSGPPLEGCGNRPKSFTVSQLQAHKHRLASSTPARSTSPPLTSSGHARCIHQQHSGTCSGRNCAKCLAQRQRQAVSTSGSLGLRREGSGTQVGQYKPLTMSFSGGVYCAGDMRLLSSSPGGLPQRGLLMAESVSVEYLGKGFKCHWYSSNRVLQVYDGSRPADPQALLKFVPQLPGLHLWLVKPPCSRQWVPVRLAAADNLRQALSECLHADGSCGPPGSKQRVLLDLQCRGFAVQVRYRPLKPSCGTVQQDLLSKLQRFDFALNDADNNGCRPIELPDGRPVYSYPLVVGHMMRVFEQLFVQPKLL